MSDECFTQASSLCQSLWRFSYSSVHSFHLFLTSSASVRSLTFLTFIVPIILWGVPLVALIFLKRSILFTILLFFSNSCSVHLWRLSYLSLLFSRTLHSIGYIFPFLFAFHFSYFLSCFKASSGNPFFFSRLFFLGTVLVTTSHTMLETSNHSYSGFQT